MKRKPENINNERQNMLNKTLNICNETGPEPTTLNSACNSAVKGQNCTGHYRV